LYFDLGEPESAGLPSPQWSPDAVNDVRPPARLIWSYRKKAAGELSSFTADQVQDGTLGFRRSGVISFQIPEDWALEKGSAPGDFRYALSLRFEKSRFTAPPRLQRLITNVVIAAHRRMLKLEINAGDWLSLPGRTIALSDEPAPLAAGRSPIEQSVKLCLKERDGKCHEWKLTDDLTFHGPRDRVFLLDRERAEISFGDGLTGRLPAPASGAEPNIRIQYEVGAGEAGNVGKNLRWELPSRPPSLDKALIENIVPAIGGADPETLASARERAGGKLQARTRAITRDDYREIAVSTPGVVIRRARAAIGAHPQHPCTPVAGAVTVFIVPAAPREELAEDFADTDIESVLVVAPMPDPGALAAVDRGLQNARLVGSDVFVRSPRYRPVELTIEIDSDSASRAEIGLRIKRRLLRFLDPLIGGDEHSGWPFGQPLRPSVITREAQLALDDEGRIERVLIRLLDSSSAAESCHDVVIGAHNLVELRETKFHFLRPAAGNGSFHGGLR
jgi:predicted phage baseplate assembly protein